VLRISHWVTRIEWTGSLASRTLTLRQKERIRAAEVRAEAAARSAPAVA
jgi:hypothetical protein